MKGLYDSIMGEYRCIQSLIRPHNHLKSLKGKAGQKWICLLCSRKWNSFLYSGTELQSWMEHMWSSGTFFLRSACAHRSLFPSNFGDKFHASSEGLNIPEHHLLLTGNVEGIEFGLSFREIETCRRDEAMGSSIKMFPTNLHFVLSLPKKF